MAGAGMQMLPGDGPSAAPSSAPSPLDMTSISFRDQLWLNTYPLDRSLVFDYFALSPFYDHICNNEQLRMRSIHPLDMSHLSKMTGIEYILHEAQEPHLFVLRKQKRDSPEKVTPLAMFYVLDGSIYLAPLLYNVIGSRVARSLYHISNAFEMAASKLEKIGYDAESDTGKVEGSTGEEGKKLMDDKEVVRIDKILTGILRKLPPAPPPPMPVAFGASQSPADLAPVANPQESNRIERTSMGKVSGSEQGLAKRIKLEL
ncbi:hypothetical protein O6H91_16G045800 [Diphasiastrum complanatum]|uniref:Uncharacterized protein n=3 Tax=Diphasiastrum complanatum TaxID=34168 RepID=A0ACC2BBZ8_DIPCM|nr:hypothetical protein O6H91_16G045800 [Diphasiastrum complanatum]KAJ7527270.1 hypothetical protein O6H91_16G045800 [Diphasiastrum complanatum]KAJ7527271.1 hypothetical protein O6H91_16G045800 [Diphasiastrum complanatum]